MLPRPRLLSSADPAPSDLPSWPWIALPALILALLAGLMAADGLNRSAFLNLNAAAAGLAPAGFWAGLSVTGSVLGAFAVLAPTLKTRPRWLASALLAAPPALLFSQGGKRLFDEMRPAAEFAAGSYHQIGVRLYVDAFPSGHATTAFVVAAAVLLAWPDAPRRALTWGLLLLAACLVAFSRIAVGAHWPADVAAGACGGWLCGALGAALTERLRFWQKDATIRLMAGIALIASLALLLVNVGYPEARLYQIGLGAWGIGGAAAALMRERSAA